MINPAPTAVSPTSAWTVHVLTTTTHTPDGDFWLAVAKLGDVVTQRYARSEKRAVAFALADLAKELAK